MNIYETHLKNLPKFKEKHPNLRIEVITRARKHPCSPSKKLLGDFIRCKNALRKKHLMITDDEEGLDISTVIHNRAWEYIEYEEKYLEEMEHNTAAQEWIAQVVKEGNDIGLVCYEKVPKKCHRYLLKNLLENATK